VTVDSALDPRTEAAYDLGLLDRQVSAVLAPLRQVNLSADVPALAGLAATTAVLAAYLHAALKRELGPLLHAVGVGAVPHQMSWSV
jgi:hypothetical protein